MVGSSESPVSGGEEPGGPGADVAEKLELVENSVLLGLKGPRHQFAHDAGRLDPNEPAHECHQ
jgi:hypothetical protein